MHDRAGEPGGVQATAGSARPEPTLSGAGFERATRRWSGPHGVSVPRGSPSHTQVSPRLCPRPPVSSSPGHSRCDHPCPFQPTRPPYPAETHGELGSGRRRASKGLGSRSGSGVRGPPRGAAYWGLLPWAPTSRTPAPAASAPPPPCLPPLGFSGGRSTGVQDARVRVRAPGTSQGSPSGSEEPPRSLAGRDRFRDVQFLGQLTRPKSFDSARFLCILFSWEFAVGRGREKKRRFLLDLEKKPETRAAIYLHQHPRREFCTAGAAARVAPTTFSGAWLWEPFLTVPGVRPSRPAWGVWATARPRKTRAWMRKNGARPTRRSKSSCRRSVWLTKPLTACCYWVRPESAGAHSPGAPGRAGRAGPG